MKSNNITKMITICMCLVVAGFAAQLGQESKVWFEKPHPEQQKMQESEDERHAHEDWGQVYGLFDVICSPDDAWFQIGQAEGKARRLSVPIKVASRDVGVAYGEEVNP